MRDMPAHVVLESFPVGLFDAADEQWEAMLREYTLRGLGGVNQSYSSDEITRAGNALALVEQSLPDAREDDHCTLALDVPAASDFGLLQGILEDCWHLARTGELLVFPSLPEIVALRNWMCEQVTEQAMGGGPEPWRFQAVETTAYGVEHTQWDPAIAPPADTPWLVGDDHNRIVGASPAALALLGWESADLVGQRLLTVIPPQLREGHIAGFTRSVLSGGGDLLGTPLALPALRRDGTEVPITLLLTRHPAANGRSVYLARLDGRAEG